MTLYVCDLEENLTQREIETLIKQDALDGCSVSAITKFAGQVEGPTIDFDDDTDLNRMDCPVEAWERYFAKPVMPDGDGGKEAVRRA